MKALGEVAVQTLMRGTKSDIGSFKWVYSQEGEIEMSDGTKKSASVVKTDLSPSCQQNFQEDSKSHYSKLISCVSHSFGWMAPSPLLCRRTVDNST